MQYIEFHLYRVKFIRPQQLSITFDDRSPSQLFKDAIIEKPAFESDSRYKWHIGNNIEFDEFTGSFALGRTTTATLSKFDVVTRNFIEEQSEDSPYTFCIYDLRIGFVAIAKKSKLSPTVNGIARRLAKVLENSLPAIKNEIRVLIDPISDPDGFIKKLQNSFSIKKFTAYFTGPNPFDADALFQKPISVYCKEANGSSGKVEVIGESLNEETIIAVTHSTAACGNEAIAKIIEKPGQAPKRIHLIGDPIKKSYRESECDFKKVAQDMKNEYSRVRNA